MTEFLNDTYLKRCNKELKRMLKKYGDGVRDEKKIMDDPLALRFNACFYKPLLNVTKQLQPLKEKLEQCLLDHDGDDDDERFVKCKTLIHEARQKGDQEMMGLLAIDLDSALKVQELDRTCGEIATKSRHYNCHIFPAKNECISLKEKAFPCITNNACRQVYQHVNDCLGETSKMETNSVWMYLFKGQDISTKTAHERKCRQYQSDLIHCFDKYFAALTIKGHDASNHVRIQRQGPLSREQIAEKEAYIREEEARKKDFLKK